jgi:SAM-dependent methyltransferase
MDGFDATTYGERIAEVYDEIHDARFDVPATVDVLASLAGGGPVLELAIGTGRVALPLAARGLRVEGIDISPAMVAKLREKPGGEAIPVTLGDFADVGVEGEFRLIYVVFNTLFALLTQEAQVRCFARAAAHLTPDGVFVVEGFVPDLGLYDRDGRRASPIEIGVDRVSIDVGRLDAVAQRVDATHVVLTEAGVKLYPVALRYAWPSELDLMARLAGLELHHRWGGWHREPFGAESSVHVSAYARPPQR